MTRKPCNSKPYITRTPITRTPITRTPITRTPGKSIKFVDHFRIDLSIEIPVTQDPNNLNNLIGPLTVRLYGLTFTVIKLP